MFLVVFSLPPAIVLILFSDFFLSVFGPSFVEGSNALKILAAGKIIIAFTGPMKLLFNMTGNHNTALKVFGLATLMNLILNYIFIHLWGINGAAFASAITILLWNAAFVLLSKRKFNRII